MSNIGNPIRKFIAIPIDEPVQPTNEPYIKPAPEAPSQPVETPKEKEPVE